MRPTGIILEWSELMLAKDHSLQERILSCKALDAFQRYKGCPWIPLHFLNTLPDHQKAECKFKLRIVMAVFQGQIEGFFFFWLGGLEPLSSV